MQTVKLTNRVRSYLALILALGVWLLIQPLIARADTITVTNTLDSGAGSLRQAIADAAPGDTITFAGDYTIYLSSTLSIDKILTVDGSGHTVTVSGDSGGDGIPNVQVFAVGPGDVVTLTHLNIVSGTIAGDGGGIFNVGTLMVQDSTLSGNSADYGGGICNAGMLTVQGSTFSGNSAYGGGGISNWGMLTLQNSTFSGNSAYYDGGGICSRGGELTVLDSTLSGNSAYYDGGGICGEGGTLTVLDSTLSGNSAGQYGGGIFNGSRVLTAQVQNSTLSGNSADYGGGIFNEIGALLTVLDSTLSDNSATNGGGIYNYQSTLNLFNTLIANSPSGGDCFNDGGSIATNDHNLIEGNGNACGLTDGAGGSLIGVDPLLGPLADNGGPVTSSGQATFTHALLSGSPALDAGNDATCLSTDQRGVARPQGAQCDIGAFEKEQSNLSLAKWVTPVVDAPYHGAVTYTVTLSNTGALSDTAAIFTDTLPAGMDFGGWLENPGAVAVNDVITWTGTLTNQTALTFTFTAVHTGNYGDVITNTAYFSGTAQIDSKAAVFSVVAPEIAVLGNNQVIAAGDTMPSTADHTDFGGVALGRAITRTFTISNTGTADLTLTGTPAVSLTWAGTGDFNMVAQPDTPVGSNTTTTFQVSFTPSVTGTRVATVTIANNDSDENPYDFVIQGLGMAATGVTFYLPLILKNAEP